MTEKSFQRFSKNIEIENEHLKCSILKELHCRRWPSNSYQHKKAIRVFIKEKQKQLMLKPVKKQLNYLQNWVFDIRNRIIAVDIIAAKYNKLYTNSENKKSLGLKFDKFCLLKQTKLSQVSKLPPYKILVHKKNSKEICIINHPLENVLQQMFLNFLEEKVNHKLKSQRFNTNHDLDPRQLIKSIYITLRQIKNYDKIHFCKIKINICQKKQFCACIQNEYPFPYKHYHLLKRWLKPVLKNQTQPVKDKEMNLIINSPIGQSILKYLIFKSFPEKRKSLSKPRSIYFYRNTILLITNNSLLFHKNLNRLKQNLKESGFQAKLNKIPSTKKKAFELAGWTFFWQPRQIAYKRGRGLINLKPSKRVIIQTKKTLKAMILKTLHFPKKKLYIIFQQINSQLQKWANLFFFNQGCKIGKQIDHFVFKLLKKTLIKKFRYQGKFRPKWVAYNFLGLGKTNPNQRTWQFQTDQYEPYSSKKEKQVSIWMCGDVFSKNSITNFEKSRKNLPSQPQNFLNKLNDSIVKRLSKKLTIPKLKKRIQSYPFIQRLNYEINCLKYIIDKNS